MPVKTSIATVFHGGRRRWLSLDAACSAEAGAILGRFCDCTPGNGHDVAPETCGMHADHDRYTSVRAKLAARARRQHHSAALAEATAPEQRALGACRELVAAKADVNRLSRLIGEALNACPMMNAPIEYGPKGPITHLSMAYAAEEVENDHGYGGTHREWNSQHLLDDCTHCMAAHVAIQERKIARRRLGKARRVVTMIGRAA